jgi:pimeloyl-[acyl-carrier protein] methyl ester esterase
MDKPRTWILLRGLARQAEHWGKFKDQFQARFPEDQILTPDLPGMGTAKKETAPTSMTDTMEFVRKTIRAQAEGPFHIFAVSLGGMAAMNWLDQYPEEIAGAFILNSSSHLSPFYHRLRWEVWGEFLQMLKSPDARAGEKRVLEMVSNSEENRTQFLPLWETIRRTEKLNPAVPVRQLMAARSFRAPSPSEAFRKAKFFVSLGDRLVEPECSMRLAKHFGSKLYEHPWGGHDLPIDDPEWLLKRIEQAAASLKTSTMPM